jgi:uncharacterized membrane protein (UPF0136 family)
MKVETSDRVIAWLALVSGLSISAVAVYYSVAGLIGIFAAAVIPIMIMGVTLELSKLVATVWLKQNWTRAPFLVKTYLSIAVAILMLITSMGIFGYLSKAHSDQSLVSGDVQSKIAIYDEKIKTEKENIEANRKALKQMDEGVDQVLGRSTDEKGADKAVAMRKSQQKERTRLQAEILQSQKSIAEFNDARAPIAAEVRKVEAEVGPIKYIAAMIYGDNPDNNLLERAVRWVIIMIVVIFDPLAVVLLLASQYSFQWLRENKEDEPNDTNTETLPPGWPFPEEPEKEEYIKWPGGVGLEEVEKPATMPFSPDSKLWPFPSIVPTPVEEVVEEEPVEDLDIKKVYPSTEEEMEEFNEAINNAKAETFAKDIDTTVFDNDAMERPGDYLTPDNTFAPPGTPGEAWTAPVNSEQQTESTIDKIYKTSAEELAKQQRSRGWFQAVFPKKSD